MEWFFDGLGTEIVSIIITHRVRKKRNIYETNNTIL